MESCIKENEGKRAHDPLHHDRSEKRRQNACSVDVHCKEIIADRLVWVPGRSSSGRGHRVSRSPRVSRRGRPELAVRGVFGGLRCEIRDPARVRPDGGRRRVRATARDLEGARGGGRGGGGGGRRVAEYVGRWLIVATGENAEVAAPDIEGLRDFKGPVAHTSAYKSGGAFRRKRVLVVGCGNSGMEVHILPREMLGLSTFGLSMWLLKWFPVRLVDQFLLLVSWFMLGDTARYGLRRPPVGPLELKSLLGKTPVLDVGTLAKIKSGEIKVQPAIRRMTGHRVEFVDGRSEDFDAIVLATGYRSNVPSWLKVDGVERSTFFRIKSFSQIKMDCKEPFPNSWKGERGLYAVGFTRRGLMGASADARRIARDIEQQWNAETKHGQSRS
uniref:Flavin-containing monooxygenase n=1 Tax=Ananas comosus var. bracteatus TaxID=296719 RepID=A0A6V7PTG1_ANACO|nr:unnamed protein product [Ananas comosus var. bracteatus]